MDRDTTLLLVEDHAVIRKGLRVLLEAEGGFRVVGEAGDGEEAVKRARETRPDVVLMDITMPGLNGIEATKAILAEAPETRVLSLSVHSTRSFVRDMLEAGARGYILKQSAPEELVVGIRRVLGGEVFLGEGVQDLVVADYLSSLSEVTAPPARPPVLIQTTKLHRPPLLPDLQSRPRLADLMKPSLRVPFTLISAPAGYGKSTLASTWIEDCGCPATWVALDEGENDPRSFLAYLLSAIQMSFPGIGRTTLALAGAPELPSFSHLSRQLANDLDEIEEPFVLVLDDLHLIHDPGVMELLAGLLQHPPPHLHLIALTRWDPPLPMSRLRARGKMSELGVEDLRFNLEETADYLTAHFGQPAKARTVEKLERTTEGWVAGIRLAALSARTSENMDRIVEKLSGDRGFISEYLFDEVLSALPPLESELLVQTSLLDRFNENLCEAIWHPPGQDGWESPGADHDAVSGARFLDWATTEQIFLVPLDTEGRWFRYHHLFRSLLQAELARRCSREQVKEIHLRASRWFAENGLPDEAIRHALAGGALDLAVKVVEANRFQIIDEGGWSQLDEWLRRLPQEAIDTSPNLLLARAWVADFRGRPWDVLAVLEQLAEMEEQGSLDRACLTEFAIWQGYAEYWTDRPKASRDTLSSALADPADMPEMARAFSEIYFAMARQAVGEDLPEITDRVRALIDPSKDSSIVLRSRASLALAFVHFLAGQLKETFHCSLRTSALSVELEDSYSHLWSSYLQGASTLHWYPSNEGCRILTEVMQNRYILDRRASADGMAALALSHHLLGRPQKAWEVSETAAEFAEWTRDPDIRTTILASRARLALLEGDLEAAGAWEEAFEAEPSAATAVFFVENPFLTQCRVLLAQASPESLRRALGRLNQLREMYSLYHNECQAIEIGVLEAAALQKMGRTGDAVEALTTVLERAAPGHWVRPFVELGPSMAGLLKEVRDQGVAVAQIQEILAAFQSRKRQEATRTPAEVLDATAGRQDDPPEASGLGQLLTEREVDVLIQLSKGFSNKAIARNLHLSTETVKKHLYNTFKKLNVNNRVAALAMARELGVLPSS